MEPLTKKILFLFVAESTFIFFLWTFIFAKALLYSDGRFFVDIDSMHEGLPETAALLVLGLLGLCMLKEVYDSL